MNAIESILRSLLRYDRPPDELLAEIEGAQGEPAEPTESDAESEELEVVFLPDDAVAVISQFIEGELDVPALEEWVLVLESRDEIVFDSEHDELLGQFIAEIPDLTEASAETWLERFEEDE